MVDKKYIAAPSSTQHQSTTGHATLVFKPFTTDLSSVVDGLADDVYAEKARISKCKIHAQFNGTTPFIGTVYLLQTAGTFTAGAYTSTYKIESVLADAVDDEVGLLPLFQPKASHYVMTYDNGGPVQWHQLSFVGNLPKKVINLLNKETQTEREQELLFGAVVQTELSGEYVTLTMFLEIEYANVSKTITIR